MLLCIPTEDERGGEALVATHFGRAPYYTIVESDTGCTRVLPNPARRHGDGPCDAAAGIRSEGVDAVLCRGLGRRALIGLSRGGIRVFRTTSPDVWQALAEYRSGRVVPMTIDEACAGGHHDHDHDHDHEGEV